MSSSGSVPPVPSLKPDIAFDELSKRCQTNELFIIDVRTPEEIKQLGKIPNSHHIDIKKFGHALLQNEAEWKAQLGVPKPTSGQEIVTTCKMGLRARTAQLALHGAGYTNVRRYAGSFDDWQERGGVIVKDDK